MVDSKDNQSSVNRILLHIEDRASDLPDLMCEEKISLKDFIPYFFLAAANNIFVFSENEREEKGWCIITTDEWGSEIKTLLSSQFTELSKSNELTEEILDNIKEKVDNILNNPEMKMSEREDMNKKVASIMKDYVVKECSSTSSPKYQQHSAEAKKALELINKK